MPNDAALPAPGSPRTRQDQSRSGVASLLSVLAPMAPAEFPAQDQLPLAPHVRLAVTAAESVGDRAITTGVVRDDWRSRAGRRLSFFSNSGVHSVPVRESLASQRVVRWLQVKNPALEHT